MGRAHLASVGIAEHHRELGSLGVDHRYVEVEPAVAHAVHEVLGEVDVGDARLGPRVEVYLAGNAGETPKVLVFKIRAVAPAHHLHGDEVAPRLQVFCDVELGSHLAVFAVTDIASVDPQREVARGRAHMEEYIAAPPVGRQVECAAV